jgi:hypothetical protein
MTQFCGSIKLMNKLKRAIAYLINKIKKAYYAARLFASILTLEFPNDRQRVDSRSRAKTTDLREGSAEPDIIDLDRPCAIANTSSSIGTARQGGGTEANPSNPSCDGLFSFFDGDFIDGFGDTTGYDPTRSQGSLAQDLQSGKTAAQEVERDRGWDLLEPRDRQAIILNAMWQCQAESDYHELFTVRDIMGLCDRADMQWELTFDDLIALKQQSRVVIFESFDTFGKKFYGFFWGLK